ncbi:hypothetical protein DYB37_004567 [Aphanomyces astaci]|uniref:Uncharacterized protein n=1 Tax=Aphanomyces astaci TaxID=112090 RepID=A0A3R6ZZT5_APHAT|nr:hypothetical protein DYB35_003770 [Aphanomyces astaci]RHZ19954.1 hypothetical protein DYB37_004567 [Aphanomyces astaci]
MPQRSFSTDVPKKEHGFRPQIHRLLYSSNTTLEEVFTMLASRVAPYDSKGSDAFFYKCLQHDSLSPSFFHDVVSYFDRFLRDDLVGPSDGAMASVVALLIKHGTLAHLLEVVRAMCVAPSSSRHTSKQQHHAAAEANKKLAALADFEAWLSRRHAQVLSFYLKFGLLC